MTGPRSRRAWFGASLVAGVLAGAWLAAGHDAFPAAEPRRAAVEPRAGSAIASRISPGAAARVAADGESAAASGGAVAVNALPAAVARRAPSAEATRIEQALDDLAGTGVGGDAAPALVLAVNAALGDADSGVREEAVALLGARGDGAQIGGLCRALLDDDARVRAAASRAMGRAIGRLGSATASSRTTDYESALAAALSDADPRVRVAVVNALAELPGDSAMTALRRAAMDADAAVRETALERLDDRHAASARAGAPRER